MGMLGLVALGVGLGQIRCPLEGLRLHLFEIVFVLVEAIAVRLLLSSPGLGAVVN